MIGFRARIYSSLCILMSLGISACQSAARSGGVDGASPAPGTPSVSSSVQSGSSQSDSPSPVSSPVPSSTPVSVSSTGWSLTVYYTAVESYHTGASTSVQGCLDMDCTSKGALGSYPSDFLQAVQEEGTGRITSGIYAGSYLNWASDTGYWLDSAPRDAQGTALIPFVSAAADSSVFSYGASFEVTDCGTDDTGGGPIDPSVCQQLKQAAWKVMDRFEPGRGGSKHLDLYIGEEDQVNFVNQSPKEISVMSAVISY